MPLLLLLISSRPLAAQLLPNGWMVQNGLPKELKLAYIRDLVEYSLNGEKVSDILLTVLSFYTQHERDAIINTIEIAGMKTLALAHDGSAHQLDHDSNLHWQARALHHLRCRSILHPRFHRIVLVRRCQEQERWHLYASAGLGFEWKVGGNELDRRLREILIRDFGKKHRTEVRNDKRVLAKLWKEAKRVRTILSANTDSSTSVSSRLKISLITDVYTGLRSKVLPMISTTDRRLPDLSLRVHVVTLLATLSSPFRTRWPTRI